MSLVNIRNKNVPNINENNYDECSVSELDMAQARHSCIS